MPKLILANAGETAKEYAKQMAGSADKLPHGRSSHTGSRGRGIDYLSADSTCIFHHVSHLRHMAAWRYRWLRRLRTQCVRCTQVAS
jgi:hypothetical protein